MKNRNLFAVFILPFVTFGIYGLVWLVKTKNEMNKLGSDVPTAWLLIVPFVSYYWLWKYSEAVEEVTSAKISTPVAFILQLVLGIIGYVIIQSEFNKLVGAPVVAAPAYVPAAPTTFQQPYAPTPENDNTTNTAPLA